MKLKNTIADVMQNFMLLHWLGLNSEISSSINFNKM